MDTIGLDLHKRESQRCIGQEDGTLEERSIATARERFTAVLGGRSRARILLEAGTESEWVARHLELSDGLATELLPLFEILAPLNEQIAAADHRLTALSREDPAVALLTTAPSLGLITATAIVATIDGVTRFRSAHQFEAFLGVVPGDRSSGEKRRIGRITKAGNARARYLPVEVGWRLLRAKDGETEALRAWALGIAARRGKRVAVVALARRLAGILYAMWRDQRPYDAARIRLPRSRAA